MLYITIPCVICLIILYVLWIWKKCIYSIPFILLFLVEMIWGLLSIIWIDNGVYITEQLRYSYFTGASIRYILLLLPFAVIFPYTTDKLIKKDIKKNMRGINIRCANINLDKIGWILLVFVIVYLYLDLIISGIPVLHTNITRSNFYSTYSKLPFSGMFHKYFLPFAMLISGRNFGLVKKKNGNVKKILFFAIIIIVFQFLLGYKFYGLCDYVIYFFMPVIAINYKKFLIKRKIPIKAIFMSSACVSVLLFICYSQYSATQANPIQYLLNRLFALQSHTFWGVDLLVQNGNMGFDWNQMISELGAAVSGVSAYDKDYGIARIMYEVTATTYANDMINSGFLFAGSFMTLSLSYSGYVLTFILSGFLGYILARVSAKLLIYSESNNIIFYFTIFYIYRRIYEYFRVGNLAIVLSAKMLILYTLWILVVFLYRKTGKISYIER